jgi:hypothetical protein
MILDDFDATTQKSSVKSGAKKDSGLTAASDKISVQDVDL